jgi:hypothetical protein
MRVGIRQRSQPVVVLQASVVPQGELDVLAVDLDIGGEVFED